MPKTGHEVDVTDAVSPKKQKGEFAPKYTLTYFAYKWIAEPIRLVLTYAKQPFDDVRIDYEKEWPAMKSKFSYAILPCLEYDNVKISQSFAIARHLAKKFGLNGKDDLEEAKIDEYTGCLMDLFHQMEPLYELQGEEKDKKKKKILEETIPKFLVKINEDLEKNGGEFLVGKDITWADFVLASYMESTEDLLQEPITSKYEAIAAHREKIFRIPEIKAWIVKRPETAC